MYVLLSCLSWTLLYINNIQRMLNKNLTRFMQSLPRIHGNLQTGRRFCWQGDIPYDGGLYGEDPPEKGTFFRPQVYERVFERAQKRLTDEFLWLYKVEKTFYI